MITPMFGTVSCYRFGPFVSSGLLASGTPAELTANRCEATLQDAFISYLLETEQQAPPVSLRVAAPAESGRPVTQGGLRRLSAYMIREWLELSRDRVRLGFAVLGTAFLMPSVSASTPISITSPLRCWMATRRRRAVPI